ncbi:hypothetical protein Q5752_003768 [Cryptotrichosporon argae]
MIMLAPKPSAAVVRAAQTAAGSPHGLVNLGRVVRALGRDESSGWIEVTKAWETVLYARALLDALSGREQGSSASAAQIDDLRQTLDEAEQRLQDVAKTTSLPTLPIPDVPLAASVTPTTLPSHKDPAAAASTVTTSQAAKPAPPAPPARRPTAPPTDAAPARALRKRPAPSTRTSEYLAQLARDDADGGEAGLLPLRVRQAKPVESGRDQLLGGVTGGLGAAQLHEELGGQLVGMSQRLRQNAIHFANSLEEEKSLLDSSSNVLEKNLANTQASKTKLSTVRKKGRGTTCLTVGVVLLVLILFIWTYLLIKFT